MNGYKFLNIFKDVTLMRYIIFVYIKSLQYTLYARIINMVFMVFTRYKQKVSMICFDWQYWMIENYRGLTYIKYCHLFPVIDLFTRGHYCLFYFNVSCQKCWYLYTSIRQLTVLNNVLLLRIFLPIAKLCQTIWREKISCKCPLFIILQSFPFY